MTCTITLYKDSKIIPDKHFVVEDIETYLASITSKITLTKFQYLRNDLNLTIKINKTEEYTESVYDYNYNYCKITQKNVNYYYFVVKKTQVAENTVALELAMDTLNTYPWETAFKVSPRTKVSREHRDRMKKILEDWELSGGFVITAYGQDHDLQPSTIEVEEADGGMILEPEEISAINEYGVIYKVTSIHDNTADIELPEGSYWDWVISGTYTDLQSLIDFICKTSYGSINGHEFEISISLITKRLKYTRIVDYISEGIESPLYKSEIGELIDNKKNFTWYLVYENSEYDSEDQNNVIKCSLTADSYVGTEITTEDTLNHTDFIDGSYYFFYEDVFNNSPVLTFSDGTKVEIGNVLNSLYGKKSAVCVRRVGSQLSYAFIAPLGKTSRGLWFETIRNIPSSVWKNISSVKINAVKVGYTRTSELPTTLNDGYVAPYADGEFSQTPTYDYLSDISTINRTDSRLIKIFSLPYCPTNYTLDIDNDRIEIGNMFVYNNVSKLYELNYLNTKFSSNVKTNVDNPLMNLVLADFTPNTSATRNDLYESKIFHSDYYQPKFVYDSFGFIFQLEKIDVEEWDKVKTEKFGFDFVMTSTINSKFMFAFPEYKLKLSTDDYDNILPVARNNELPIYNSAYITYLRTAYRYDLKAVKNQEQQLLFSAGVSGGRSFVGIVQSVMEKDAGGVGSNVSSIIGTIGSTILKEQVMGDSLRSKIAGLRAQANSVSGSDDLDLMEAYTGGRAKLVEYKVSDRLKSLLLNLFYYYGYTTNEIKKPAINTRYWFNFVACELEYTGLDKNITEVSKRDLVNKYSEGVTFLHNHSGVWDFAQEKENWETSIIGG